MIVLRSGGERPLEAEFAPDAGMVCCSLRHDGDELLAQQDGVDAYASRGATMGIPLLHPWANRLGGFAYEVGGRKVEIAGDSPLLALDANGLPIHGVISGELPWRVTGSDQASVVTAELRWERAELLAVFPFPHTLAYEARVQGSSLTIVTTLRAHADAPVPACFGFHPYLTLPGSERASWRVELPVTRRLVLDARMIPTGALEPFDQVSFALGEGSWDDAFTGLVRPTVFRLADSTREITLEFLHGYPFAQVYSPAGEPFICFEPMTAPTNALASGADLPLVAAGTAFGAAFRVTVRRTAA